MITIVDYILCYRQWYDVNKSSFYSGPYFVPRDGPMARWGVTRADGLPWLEAPPAAAFAQHAGRAYNADAFGPEVPCVCLRIPTGGAVDGMLHTATTLLVTVGLLYFVYERLQ